MMQHDGAALRVLSIGGTGTISASCVRLSVASGMAVFVLNRGDNSAAREVPEGLTWLTGDVTDDGSLGVFDTSKIRRFVPAFAPKLTFHGAARRMVQWRADHPDRTGADEVTDAVLDRIVGAYRAAREVFADRAPARVGR